LSGEEEGSSGGGFEEEIAIGLEGEEIDPENSKAKAMVEFGSSSNGEGPRERQQTATIGKEWAGR